MENRIDELKLAVSTSFSIIQSLKPTGHGLEASRALCSEVVERWKQLRFDYAKHFPIARTQMFVLCGHD
jgi:hypothetical protein